MRIYVAGPFTQGDTLINVRRAIDIGDQLQEAGYTVFIPHLSAQWHTIHAHDYEWWMTWCLDWLEVCDVLVRIEGESPGGDREVAEAKQQGKPIVEVGDKTGAFVISMVDAAIAKARGA